MVVSPRVRVLDHVRAVLAERADDQLGAGARQRRGKLRHGATSEDSPATLDWDGTKSAYGVRVPYPPRRRSGGPTPHTVGGSAAPSRTAAPAPQSLRRSARSAPRTGGPGAGGARGPGR